MPKHLVLYDGECGLCQFSVQWLLDRDRNDCLYFAPLQGETAQSFVQSGHIPAELDSIIYIRDEQEFFWFSSAILQILRVLPAPWSWGAVGRFVPKFIRDFVYKQIAANRIALFGPADMCRLPSPEEASRFLP